jgi:hypothetical protein
LVWDSCGRHEREEWDSLVEATRPSAIEDTWRFLGFDVGDRWLESGLLNQIQSGHDDYLALQTRFRSCLNDSHLFDDFREATAFKRCADSRTPDHAPYFVYGLRLVEMRGVDLPAHGDAV